MLAAKRVVLLATALMLVLPPAAYSAGASLAASPSTTKRPPFFVAQYDEGAFGPGDDAGPDGPRGYYPRRPRSGGVGGATSYHGFRIVFGGTQSDAALAEVEHQIDIVDSAGLSASNMRLFRSRPIAVNGRGRNESNRGTSVVLGNLQGAQSRPVLLHEFMHIFHRSLPGGFNNPTIERFYREAVANNLYPAGSYTMSNRREFFAVTASCYLYGSVERPPYTRQAIAQQQPDYYAYLGQLFGGGRGSLAPSGRYATKLAAAR